MPKTLTRILVTTLLPLVLASSATAQQVAFGALLTGTDVVPASGSPAKGTASVLMDLAADTLTVELTYSGLVGAETSASIHGYATFGANAPALFSLPLGFDKSAVVSYPPADEAQILANLAYIEIRSTAFPGGEIRGQLLHDSSTVSMAATLDGQQVPPPTGSSARGTAHCSIDVNANKLTFLITWEGIVSAQTAAHIHGPAAPGQTGPPRFALPVGTASHHVGVWNYDEPDEADILAGLMYLNVHSDSFPAGEIRGQILPLATNPSTYCTAKTTSLGCTPAIGASGVPSASAGTGFLVTTAPVPGGKLGIFFYGTSGPAAIPFQAGFICAQSPIRRTPVSASGGSPASCNGMFTMDFNAFVAASGDPALTAGALVSLQTWFRDPPNPQFGTGLSDALLFELRQ